MARRLVILVGLALLVFAVFAQTGGFDFVNLDDPAYVIRNANVREGLTSRGLAWSLTSFHLANWHPLTWISHMADVSIFGLDAGRHHQVNLLIHILNTLLLFLVLSEGTGNSPRSALVAALFGVHPLHVESVAWISERKDLLCAFFFLLAAFAHVRGVKRGREAGGSLSVVLPFTLALLCKPMAVTLPFVLLLLDAWPLARGISWARLVREKIPLFLLSAASSVMTILAQRSGGSIGSAEAYPYTVRAANALVALWSYLWKAVWPSGLSVFYPHPASGGPPPPGWEILVSAFFLAAATCGVLQARKHRPFLAVGWFWFLGMLFPVIGLVQAGDHAMADRYTYLPLVGLFVMAAWGMPDLASAFRIRKEAVAAAAVAATVLLASASWRQTGYWRNSGTLFGHALETVGDHWRINLHLGHFYHQVGDAERAVHHYSRSIATERYAPRNFYALSMMGLILMESGRVDEAIRRYEESLQLNPDSAETRYNLGLAYQAIGREDDAALQFREAERLAGRYHRGS